ncbi:MAG: substrate-binding domain-containing protein [Gammaproteobacteria bacterium]|nr:substrate-binding domain-containing protein [Gammaproteobacteria bacterium]MDH5651592.1 substrate-binding domain-containing protein [Gammaproteobacteria bacterium]
MNSTSHNPFHRLLALQILGVFCFLFGLPACAASPLQEGDDIVGAGAHFSWIIFNKLKPELEQMSGRKISLYGKNSMLGQGCNAGIKTAKLSNDKRDTFGFVCCALSDEEIKKNNLIVYPIAHEPVLILLNKSNPVQDLSKQQVRDIFSGKITNWKNVGGKNQPIVVVTRLHCKKRPGHWKRILPEADRFRADRINVKSADEMSQRVNDFPGAIGHIGSTWIFEAGDKTKSITVDGIKPTADNIKQGHYPFYRKLSAVTTTNPNPDVVRIIRETQTGPAFRQLARQFELLPLN